MSVSANGTRTVDLGEGAMLFQIPKGAGRLKIETAAIAVASTGATAIIERHGQFYVKVLVLEGTVRCYLTNRLGESLLLQPGQILIAKPDVTALPEPADFDIAREMKTCLLVREFQPLPSQRWIESEEQKQLNLIAKGTYIPSNLVILDAAHRSPLLMRPSTTPPPKPLTNTGHQSRTLIQPMQTIKSVDIDTAAYELKLPASMKKIFAGTPHTKFIAAASALTWTIAMANSAGAAQLQEARVTQVVNDVKLLLEQAAPRPAAISDLIRHGNAVRTGTQSRSELTFADLTITRLGANTIFSFKEGTREMNLIDGAILFQVPKGSGGATIRTVGVTAAITGTTGIAEFHPATTSHPQPSASGFAWKGRSTFICPMVNP